jgi:CubicO group peptidase (beta-lactamase class C family)
MQESRRVDILLLRLLVVGLSLCPCLGWTAVAVHQCGTEAIDTLASIELRQDDVGAVTAGVVSGEKLAWTKSYGYADMEHKIPANKDTVYRIGSITKQFTALMLLQLVEQGKVQLSDPVEKYFPEINRVPGQIGGEAPITIGQLATHTSGLGREPADLAKYVSGSVSDWEAILISALPQVKYDFRPGERFSYSNVGYAILGAALSRAAGQPYTEYVAQHIFKPLGMNHTAFEPNDQITAQLAVGYDYDPKSLSLDTETPMREHRGRGYKVPNGAIYTTVGDLAKFLSFELGHGPESVLQEGSLDQNFRSARPINGNPRSAYGIGFSELHLGTLIVDGHDGEVAGYTAAAFVDRASDTGVVVLRNVSGGPFNADRLALRALSCVAKP